MKGARLIVQRRVAEKKSRNSAVHTYSRKAHFELTLLCLCHLIPLNINVDDVMDGFDAQTLVQSGSDGKTLAMSFEDAKGSRFTLSVSHQVALAMIPVLSEKTTEMAVDAFFQWRKSGAQPATWIRPTSFWR